MKTMLPCALLAISTVLSGGTSAAPMQVADKITSSAPSREAVNKNADGLAVSGYDVVSYFDQKQAMKGNEAYRSNYQGATYQFISAEHRDTFARNPDSFVPQYGGFCAVGTAQGHKAPADPKAWTVIDGKLYLNYNKDVQKAFLKDPSSKLSEANAKWPKLNK